MPYGLNVWTPSGYIQIDENYSNYAAYSSGTITADTSVGQGLIWARCPVGGALSYVNFTLRAQASYPTSYIVSKPMNEVAENGDRYGLQVFNAGGSLIFSSRATFVTLLGMISIPGNNASGPYYTLPTPSAGKQIYLSVNGLAQPQAMYQPYVNGGAFLFPAIKWTAANQIQSSMYSTSGPPATGSWYHSRYVLIGEF